MSRLRSRMQRLEKKVQQRPVCPCQDPSGPVEFIVIPPRVIGEPYDEPALPPPSRCQRCGRESPCRQYVIRAPRGIPTGGSA